MVRSIGLLECSQDSCLFGRVGGATIISEVVTVTALTVMTWNVQNLFTPDSTVGPVADAYRAKLATLAGLIDRVAPDVLALQEIGADPVLADLAAACATKFDHHLAGVADGRGIRVGLLSTRRFMRHSDITRFPDHVQPVQISDDDTTGQTGRGLLSGTIRVGTTHVTVIAAHLKSKLISYPRPDGSTAFAPTDEGQRLRHTGYAVYRRTAEAMTGRDALNDALTAPGRASGEGDGTGRETAVVFCGDLNDGPDAATTQVLQGPGGSEIDLNPGSGFQTGDHGDGWRMWNLYRLLPTGGPHATRVYRGHGELIDHILASHRLVNPTNLPAVRIAATAELASMTDTPHQAPPSDHAAVVATFQL